MNRAAVRQSETCLTALLRDQKILNCIHPPLGNRPLILRLLITSVHIVTMAAEWKLGWILIPDRVLAVYFFSVLGLQPIHFCISSLLDIRSVEPNQIRAILGIHLIGLDFVQILVCLDFELFQSCA